MAHDQVVAYFRRKAKNMVFAHHSAMYDKVADELEAGRTDCAIQMVNEDLDEVANSVTADELPDARLMLILIRAVLISWDKVIV